MENEKFEKSLRQLSIYFQHNYAPLLRKSMALLKLILEEKIDDDALERIRNSFPKMETESSEIFVAMMKELKNLSDLIEPQKS
jgi:hypothetical protein